MIDNVPSFLASLTSWLISEGVWFFPLLLLFTNFAFKCFVHNEPDKTDFCQSIIAVPAEIKVVACSFVFASAVSSTSAPVEAFALQIIALIFLALLAISIGWFNKCDAAEASTLDGSVLTYLVVSLLISLLMLSASIQLMMHAVK